MFNWTKILFVSMGFALATGCQVESADTGGMDTRDYIQQEAEGKGASYCNKPGDKCCGPKLGAYYCTLGLYCGTNLKCYNPYTAAD